MPSAFACGPLAPLPRALGVHNCIDGYECQNENGLIAVWRRLVPRCSRARRVPPDRSPEGCQAKQPAIHGSSQSGQPHFHIARHNIACNARPPSLPPSFHHPLACSFVRLLPAFCGLCTRPHSERSVRSCYRTALKPLKKEGASASSDRGVAEAPKFCITTPQLVTLHSSHCGEGRRRADDADADLRTTRCLAAFLRRAQK